MLLGFPFIHRPEQGRCGGGRGPPCHRAAAQPCKIAGGSGLADCELQILRTFTDASSTGAAAGWGASPEGSRPFLDALDVASGAKRRLWQSQATCLEQTGSLLSDAPGAPLRCCSCPGRGPMTHVL